MPISKKYMHDRLILLLLSVNVFFAFLCIVLVLLKLGIGQSADGYIVQYRSNLGITAFKTGSVFVFFSFIGFTLLTLVTNIILSIRTYSVRRELSIAILVLGAVLVLTAIVVSNGLLGLH